MTRAQISGLATGSAMLVLLLAQSAAAAPKPRVGVLSVDISGAARPELRDQFEKSLAGGLYAAGFEVVGRAEVARSLKKAPELVGCTTTTCLEQVGGMVKADRFVRVKAEVDEGSYTFELDLLSTAEGVAQHVEDTCGVCTLAEANDMLSKLASGLTSAATAHVTVRTDPPGATLVIDGQPAGEAPLELDLPAGPHRFEAKLDGHTPGVQETTLEPGGANQEVVIALLTAEARPQRYRVWKWVAAGTGVAALGAGIGLLAINGDCAQDPVPPSTQCRRSYNTVTAGVLLVGVGVLAGGASVYMFLADKRAAEPVPATSRRVTLAPFLGGATLSLEF